MFDGTTGGPVRYAISDGTLYIRGKGDYDIPSTDADWYSDRNSITKIVVEEVRPEGGYGVGNTKTHRALMWLQAATAFLIHDNYSSVEIEYIYPSSWRAALGIKNGRGIKRTSLKEQDIQYVQEKYNITVNDDEADAICIGLSQYKEKDSNEINWE